MRFFFLVTCAIAMCACTTTSIEDVDAADGSDDRGTISDAPSSDAPWDGMCPPNQVYVYTHPGCGPDAGICRDPVEDACAISFCSCTGQWVIGCDYVSEPFQSSDACAPDAKD